MDLSSIVMPGVQNIVTAILGDAWTATRDLIARRLGHGNGNAHGNGPGDGGKPGAADDHNPAAESGATPAAEPAAESVTAQVSRELELLRTRSLEPFADAEPDRRFLEGFWYGHLTRMLDDHPDLAGVLAELVAGSAEPHPTVSVVSHVGDVSTVSNVNSGEVGRLLQNTGDIHGGVTMN